MRRRDQQRCSSAAGTIGNRLTPGTTIEPGNTVPAAADRPTPVTPPGSRRFTRTPGSLPRIRTRTTRSRKSRVTIARDGSVLCAHHPTPPATRGWIASVRRTPGPRQVHRAVPGRQQATRNAPTSSISTQSQTSYSDEKLSFTSFTRHLSFLSAWQRLLRAQTKSTSP